MSNASKVYVVVAPRWRAGGRPMPALGTRPLLRWELVRETRPVVANGITTSAAEHVSFHWTKRRAFAELWSKIDGSS